MKQTKTYQPNANALPALLDPEAEQQRLASIDAHRKQLNRENEAARNIRRALLEGAK